MKAIVIQSYGTPDVLRYMDVPTPVPKDKEILIQVQAAVVGPADCAFRKADPFIVRLLYGLRRPKFSILGSEFAGEVAAVGKDVTQFKIGDRVFGLSPNTFGTHAEYMCVLETDPVVKLADGMTYEDAVGICDGAPTALTFLRDTANLKAGQKVLVNGASGSVGAYAIQLAKHFGAEVTGVCSGTNVALVKALGADKVIDYTQTDFTQSDDRYDVIFDAVGKSSFSRCKNVLTAQGVYLSTVPTLAIVFDLIRTSLGHGKKAKFATAGLMQNKDNFNFLNQLFADGKLKAVIDRHYPLKDVPAAHHYVETGHKKGNVIITVGYAAS